MSDRMIALLAAASILGVPSVHAAGPTYDSPQTKSLIEDMLEAHGGMASWRAVTAFRYTATMHLTVLPPAEGRTWGDSWRVYTVTVDPKTHRGQVELPLEEGAAPSAAWNGDQLWRRAYEFDPQFQDPPHMLLYFHYSMLTLPFHTQTDGVSLSKMAPDSLPGYPELHDVVEMSFPSKDGKNIGTYLLYLDRETHRLRGWRQTARYPLLQGSVIENIERQEAPRQATRVVDSWRSVDGMLIPETYVTVGQTPDGSVRLASVHLVRDPSGRATLDPDKLRTPDDARVVLRRTP